MAERSPFLHSRCSSLPGVQMEGCRRLALERTLSWVRYLSLTEADIFCDRYSDPRVRRMLCSEGEGEGENVLQELLTDLYLAKISSYMH